MCPPPSPPPPSPSPVKLTHTHATRYCRLRPKTVGCTETLSTVGVHSGRADGKGAQEGLNALTSCIKTGSTTLQQCLYKATSEAEAQGGSKADLGAKIEMAQEDALASVLGNGNSGYDQVKADAARTLYEELGGSSASFNDRLQEKARRESAAKTLGASATCSSRGECQGMFEAEYLSSCGDVTGATCLDKDLAYDEAVRGRVVEVIASCQHASSVQTGSSVLTTSSSTTTTTSSGKSCSLAGDAALRGLGITNEEVAVVRAKAAADEAGRELLRCNFGGDASTAPTTTSASSGAATSSSSLATDSSVSRSSADMRLCLAAAKKRYEEIGGDDLKFDQSIVEGVRSTMARKYSACIVDKAVVDKAQCKII